MACPTNTVDSMVTCLRAQSAYNITAAQWHHTDYWFDPPFAPVVDSNFLPDLPSNMLQRNDVKDTEVILGVNKDEGIFWLLYYDKQLFPKSNAGELSREDFSKHVLPDLSLKANLPVQKGYLWEYVDSLTPADRDSYRDVADDISGDHLFKCPVVDFAQAYARASSTHDVYLYSFEHRLSNNPWPAWTGVMHGYEIEAVFGLPLPYNYTQRETNLAARITDYWTRFAQFG